MAELDDRDDRVYFSSLLIILPISTVFMSVTACLLGYVIAVETDSVKPYPFFPYISQLGDLRPESNIYTFFMIISCFLTSYIIIIRYFQVKETHDDCRLVNKLSVGFGAAFVLGKVMVTTLQITCIKPMHYVGAGVYFVGVIAYVASQVYLTYKTLTPSKMCLLIVRIICFVGIVACIVTYSTSAVFSDYSRYFAATAEWSMAIFKITFMLTFLGDFWQVKMRLQLNFHIEQTILN